jgi:hypothetical protein
LPLKPATSGRAKIRIAITPAAFEAIPATLPLGSVGYEPQLNAKGERLIWLEAAVVDCLAAVRGSSEFASPPMASANLFMAHWGRPGPPQFGGQPVTNIRNVKALHWWRLAQQGEPSPTGEALDRTAVLVSLTHRGCCGVERSPRFQLASSLTRQLAKPWRKVIL